MSVVACFEVVIEIDWYEAESWWLFAGAGTNLVSERKSQDFESVLDFDVQLCSDLTLRARSRSLSSSCEICILLSIFGG